MADTQFYEFLKPTVGGSADAWGGNLNDDLDDLDGFLARLLVPFASPVDVTGTTTCNLATALVFYIDGGAGATTLAFTNVPTLPSGDPSHVRVLLAIEDGGTNISWPASVVWPGDDPDLKPGFSLVQLDSIDDGTTWLPAVLRRSDGTVVPGDIEVSGQAYLPPFDNGSKVASFTVDWSKGNHQYVTVTGAGLGITLSNGIAGAVYLLVIEQGDGSDTVIWPASVRWPSGTAPTLSTASGRRDAFTLFCVSPALYVAQTFGLNYNDA